MVIINIGKNITYPYFVVADSPLAVNPSCVLSLSPNAAHNTKQCIVVCITALNIYYTMHRIHKQSLLVRLPELRSPSAVSAVNLPFPPLTPLQGSIA